VTLTSLLFPLFGSIFLGAGTRSFRLFDGEDARRMARFVFMIAMPFAGFEFMRRSQVDGEIILGLAGGYVLSLLIITAAVFVLARGVLKLTVREAGAAVFSSTCGNAIFLGIPIAASVEGWASPFLILVLFEGTLVFAIGTALMTWPDESSAGGEQGAVLRAAAKAALRAATNPIVIGTVLGLLASLASAELPEPVDRFLAFTARTAGPLGLFVLGVSAADLVLSGKASELRGAALLLPFKLVLFPLLTAGLVFLFTGDATATSVAALFTGLPPAVASIVLASVYRQWVGGTAGVVTAGTLVGLATLTLYLIFILGS
jgi:predicted permease